ncbi:ABC transporter permease [Clostridium sp. KNHs205]|jgi:ABC-2 type transport system permease protein|uniref:ABC transporter permease n=1 Tax=Clostridium sp. KNHs205 TaxID=1449050 RepID=UPI001FA7F8F1|nr:ABC transporter permease [Clostridium sp. KNHs205]
MIYLCLKREVSIIKRQFNKLIYYISKDLLEYVRYKTAIISNVLLSLIMVKAFGDYSLSGGFGTNNYYLYMLPGILSMGAMNNCIFSASYNVSMDREKHLMDDVVLSPSSYFTYMTAKYIGNYLKALLQFALVMVLSIYYYDVTIDRLGMLFLYFSIGAVMFISIGMLLASITDILSLGGLANLIIVPFTYFSGIFFPVTGLDGITKEVAKRLPITSLNEMLRYSVNSQLMFGYLRTHVIYVSIVTLFLSTVTLVIYYKKLKRGY